ncbi:copper amine oxidase N-terminal domain-containing protein [Paenibacillus sp. P22]|uniref:copper amine oxidase N-terminal domain-containing protein n=1 Tax=Paenibacillus sp. P22 TaxID=483908 RepID=UPI00038F755C|nr:copper amine oxidase N-terminal domain-containing protein [Paenibacillus sp. P22]CDN43275.1 Copper amine oxidase domain protein [Paenibacillus sp. P22]
MKKHPKGKKALLSAAILSLTAASVIPMASAAAASEPATAVPINAPISSPQPEEQQPVAAFAPVTGKVKEIADFGKTGDKLVTVVSEGDSITNFVVSKNTYSSGTDLVKSGAELTVFYDTRKPAIMIYPPQFPAEVIVPAADGASSWKVDQFTTSKEGAEGLLSLDKMLLIRPSDQTKIILEDGTPFTGELSGRSLAVKYGISTKSIPAQAAPEEIVVLFEEAVPPIGQAPGDGAEPVAPIDVTDKTIVVEGKILKGSAAYTDAKGTVMVPLRPIAEALKYKLTWDAKTKSTLIGPGSSLQIGKDYYVYNRTAPIELGTAPALVKGSTYVPLSYFTEVLRMSNAYVFEDTIVIDNGEKMQ